MAGTAGAQPGRLACGQDGGRICSSVCGCTSAHLTQAGGSLVEEEPLLGFPSLGALGTPPVGLNLCSKCRGFGLGLSTEVPLGSRLFPFPTRPPRYWLLVLCLPLHGLLLAVAPPNFTSAFQAQKRRRGSRLKARPTDTEFCFVGLKNFFFMKHQHLTEMH